jgi:hypothetical protein
MADRASRQGAKVSSMKIERINRNILIICYRDYRVTVDGRGEMIV